MEKELLSVLVEFTSLILDVGVVPNGTAHKLTRKILNHATGSCPRT